MPTTTKKKTSKRKPSKVTRKKAVKPRKRKKAAVPQDNEGLLQLTKEDLTRYELAQYRVSNDAQAIKLKHGEIVQVKQEAAQRVTRLASEISTLQASQKEHATELKALQDEIGSTYGVDMSLMSYDDTTGRIYLDGAPVPVS